MTERRQKIDRAGLPMERTPTALLSTWFLDPDDQADRLQRDRAYARHAFPEAVCVSCPDPILAGRPRVSLGDSETSSLYVCARCCSRSTDRKLRAFAVRAASFLRRLHWAKMESVARRSLPRPISAASLAR